MFYTTEKYPDRSEYIYEACPGGGYIGYHMGARPDIQWNHIDGPLLHFRNGEMHWLTWRERFCCWMGWESAISLERKYRPHLEWQR